MERVCIYLRKSRQDMEAEARGEGETLAKHKQALLRTAKSMNLNIIKIREEIVSGESLLHRPQMNELLKEVSLGEYDAVLVMDVDRLGRGNMQEQGLILETFRESNTKIITPRKTYDLNDEFDEEYSEFEAFMARKELKIITRRLQGGRLRSVEEGNYIGTRPPYGWEIEKDGKSRYLVPHPTQFKVMVMMYELYAHEDPEERMGSNKIASRLNELGFRTYTDKPWKAELVLNIIKSPINIGYLSWGKKKYKKTPTGRTVATQAEGSYTKVLGKHRKYVTPELEALYNRAMEFLGEKYHVPYQLENGISNPLAGLIKCGKCGYAIVLRPYTGQPSHLMCPNKECPCKSVQATYVFDAVLGGLQEWLEDYKIQWDKHKPSKRTSNALELKEIQVKAFQKEAEDLELQKGRLHDFLERGIYDEETFLERSAALADRISATHQAIVRAEEEVAKEMKQKDAELNIIPMVKNVIKLYKKTDDPAKQNALLKSVINKVVYSKEKHEFKDSFSIELDVKVK
ncbi:recombinase family protein [Paenibacillus sp. FSL R5-0519]|uniref:recombinase family protein n=1 Tax=Paenibacillus sp. FSL R5-0519 TaxID=2921648 RepID=UPI0030D9E3A8